MAHTHSSRRARLGSSPRGGIENRVALDERLWLHMDHHCLPGRNSAMGRPVMFRAYRATHGRTFVALAVCLLGAGGYGAFRHSRAAAKDASTIAPSGSAAGELCESGMSAA